VVIPCYNQAHFLGEAIESVLMQSYPHTEVVVVDDGSQDNTSEVAARYPGVRCVRQPNGGQADARNTGIRHTNGSCLVFLDSDDRLLPEALQAGLTCLAAHSESAYSVGRFRHIDVNGVETAVSNSRTEEQRAYYFNLLRFEGHSVHHSVMYRREALEYVHGFNPSFQECADYDLHLRTTRLFLISFHNTVVAEYRRYGGGVSYNNLHMLRSMKRVFRSQWQYVKNNGEYREAYTTGIRAIEDLYGQPAISDLRGRVQETGWWASRRDIFTFLYSYPRGLSTFLKLRRK
jgi:glycosyltransferase involved in cell wall biosynthesis